MDNFTLGNSEDKEIARFFYVPEGKEVSTNLKRWLSKELEFHEVKYAKFGNFGDGVSPDNNMMLSVVEFDKDHCVYVLMEKSNFDDVGTL